MRRVRATIVSVEKQWVLHILSVCICSLRCPACNALAPYCHLWPVPLPKFFFTLPHKWHVFRKRVIEHKMYVSSFSTTFVYNIFNSKKIWAKKKKKINIVLHVKHPLILSDSNETEFSPQIFENTQIPNFM
jgi:hypothetical protein